MLRKELARVRAEKKSSGTYSVVVEPGAYKRRGFWRKQQETYEWRVIHPNGWKHTGWAWTQEEAKKEANEYIEWDKGLERRHQQRRAEREAKTLRYEVS